MADPFELLSDWNAERVELLADLAALKARQVAGAGPPEWRLPETTRGRRNPRC
jgi:hypothetical protein